LIIFLQDDCLHKNREVHTAVFLFAMDALCFGENKLLTRAGQKIYKWVCHAEPK